MPNLIPNREVITTHHFNIDITPIQIVWGKRELEVNERKNGLQDRAKQVFKSVVDAEVKKQIDEYPETQYDAVVVNAARIVFEARMDAISAAVTHEDIDALEA